MTTVETGAQRAKRERQRVLFDGVAELYDATRVGYPDEIVDLMLRTAGAGMGTRVLEIGCGTGQLTRQLAGRGLALTAIDIGAAMVETARTHVADLDVRFEVTQFEDYAADAGTFDLIVSATAFHWIDPEVGWSKVSRLLRPGGWLALLETGERYDDPLGAALLELCVRYSDDGGAFARRTWVTCAEYIARTGLFEPPLEHRHMQRRVLAPQAVLGLEHTRQTTLSYDERTRATFAADLAALMRDMPEVKLEQHTELAMAQVLGTA